MDSEINFATPAQHFNDESAACKLLEGLRWPNGPVCLPLRLRPGPMQADPKPKCERPVRRGVYKCKGCRLQFTVTVGTFFESCTPLHKWLMAVYLMCAGKKGIVAHHAHWMLGITYKSAWFMCDRIRYALTQPPLVDTLRGIIEAAVTYAGGRRGVPSAGRAQSQQRRC